MSGTNWYRKAWEGLWNVADDYESQTLDDLAIRAGIYWQCKCGWSNRNDESPHCDKCGKVKAEAAREIEA